jgi:hypothetical protein
VARRRRCTGRCGELYPPGELTQVGQGDYLCQSCLVAEATGEAPAGADDLAQGMLEAAAPRAGVALMRDVSVPGTPGVRYDHGCGTPWYQAEAFTSASVRRPQRCPGCGATVEVVVDQDAPTPGDTTVADAIVAGDPVSPSGERPSEAAMREAFGDSALPPEQPVEPPLREASVDDLLEVHAPEAPAATRVWCEEEKLPPLEAVVARYCRAQGWAYQDGGSPEDVGATVANVVRSQRAEAEERDSITW